MAMPLPHWMSKRKGRQVKTPALTPSLRAPQVLSLTRLESRRLLSAAPIADAGGPYSVDEGGSVVLDASGTTDDVDPNSNLYFEWDLDGDGVFGETGADAARGDEIGMNPVFTAWSDDGNGQAVNVSLRVFDSDENVGTAEASVTINNVAPTVSIAVNPSRVEESSFFGVTVSGTVTDPVDDISNVVISWGDGTTSTSADGGVQLSFIEGGVAYTATRSYPDDPEGTAADETYSIVVTATDDDGGIGTASSSVIVDNTDPQISSLFLTSSVNEGSSVFLEFWIYDQGFQDELTVAIDWGDGVIETFANVEQGYGQFSHVYRDDGPSGSASHLYTVIISLTDDDGGLAAVTAFTTVNNVDPVFDEVVVPLGPINEGQEYVITGSFDDVGLDDTHSLSVDWGDGTTSVFGDGSITIDQTARTFTATHVYTLENRYFPVLTLTDDDGGQAFSGDFFIDVLNVAPDLADLAVSSSEIVEGDFITLTGRVVDPGDGWFLIVIEWGDGSTTTLGDDGPTAIASNTANAPPPDFFDFQTRRFSASHYYIDDDPTGTPFDVTLITVTVYDSSENYSEAVVPITVFNADPIVTLEPASPNVVRENDGFVTITGRITDAGIADEHVVIIDWRDGSVTRSDDRNSGFTFNEDGTFTAYHYYVDDNPTGTPEDIYSILVTVVDDDGGVGTATTDVLVQNVAPELYYVSVDRSVVDENSQPVTVSGFVFDQGFEDELTIVIDWGDGTFSSSADGSVSIDVEGYFTATHIYVDDTPSGTPSDVFTIIVTATDDDGGQAVDDSQTVTVRNVAPTLSGLLIDREIDENQIATLQGRISDASPLDSFQLLVDWGDGTRELFSYAAGTTSFSEQHLYRDDNPSGTGSDQYRVTVTLIDDDTGRDFDETTITVRNVAPVIEQLQLDQSSVQVGQPVTLTGRFSDQGLDDVHQIVIVWGDGSTSSVAAGSVSLDIATGRFQAVHIYQTASAEPWPITVFVQDDDTGETTGRLAVSIVEAPDVEDPLLAVPGLNTLIDRPLIGAATPTVAQNFAPFAGLDNETRPRFTEPPAVLDEIAVSLDDSSNLDFEETTSDNVAIGTRVVLRVLGPSGALKDEIELDEEVLKQLPGWYSRLLDDHYRIYLIREDGTELMHSDVVVREGRPVDPNDALENDDFTTDRYQRNESPRDAVLNGIESREFREDDERQSSEAPGEGTGGPSTTSHGHQEDIRLLDEAIQTWRPRPSLALRASLR